MTREESATPDYTMGFGEEFIGVMRRFTARRQAGYLLPYLRPGLRVLDFGCGPGTISVGLARAVAPGEMHGIDMEESQIGLARTLAEAGGHTNAIFHVGDVTDLPFEDNYFDIAHGHNVLMHVPDTEAVLAEIMRVLKPGGIIGCGEMICGSSFTYADHGQFRRAWDIFEDILSNDDGHPQMGRELKSFIPKAGFENLRMSASFDMFSNPEEVAFIYNLVQQWFLSPEFMEKAIQYGVATRRSFEDIRVAYDKWSTDPDAFLAVAYGEAIANKPVS